MSLSKRIDKARNAFTKRDKVAAAHIHHTSQGAALEEHGGEGAQYVGDIIYGGLDGIITTFAIVSGVAGAQLESGIILVLGLANLIADGFSMAAGAYLSLKSEQAYYDKEKERELWEVENFPEGEKQEMHQIYLQQGYTPEEAAQLVDIKSRDPKRWVDAMMIDELRMTRDDRKPMLSGLTTFISFIIAGSVPLLIYLVGLVHVDVPSSFEISILLSALALFGLGTAKVWITLQNPFQSGFEMLVVGGLASGVAYAVGALLRNLIPV
jgi:VIT1/CCC1 family predicted Fe2+/Mn2+ transporter